MLDSVGERKEGGVYDISAEDDRSGPVLLKLVDLKSLNNSTHNARRDRILHASPDPEACRVCLRTGRMEENILPGGGGLYADSIRGFVEGVMGLQQGRMEEKMEVRWKYLSPPTSVSPTPSSLVMHNKVFLRWPAFDGEGGSKLHPDYAKQHGNMLSCREEPGKETETGGEGGGESAAGKEGHSR